MSATVTIGGVPFSTSAVGQATVAAVLQDPVVMQVVWRDVYEWDARSQSGKALISLNAAGAAPLPNAVIFFVPRVQPDGNLTKNAPASARMAQRFVDHVGADGIGDLAKAVADLVQLPHKTLPLAKFAALNPAASYRVRMHTSHVVVQLRQHAEDLSAFLCIPSRVSFHHEITAIQDDDSFQDLLKAQPGLRTASFDFVVPAKSKANAGLRRLAIAKRIEDEKTALTRVTSDVSSVTLSMLREKIARSEAEWDALKSA